MQVVLVQSPMGSLILFSGSWCLQNFVSAVQDWSVCFPQSSASASQIPLTLTARFPGDSQSLCWISRLGRRHGVKNLHNTARTSLILLFSSLWMTHPMGMEFDFIMIEPLLLSHCGFFFAFGREVFVCFVFVGSSS